MQKSQGLLLLHSNIIPSSGLKMAPDDVDEVMLSLVHTSEPELRNISMNKYFPIISLCEKESLYYRKLKLVR